MPVLEKEPGMTSHDQLSYRRCNLTMHWNGVVRLFGLVPIRYAFFADGGVASVAFLLAEMRRSSFWVAVDWRGNWALWLRYSHTHQQPLRYSSPVFETS